MLFVFPSDCFSEKSRDATAREEQTSKYRLRLLAKASIQKRVLRDRPILFDQIWGNLKTGLPAFPVLLAAGRTP
jgi:hypothetical protein